MPASPHRVWEAMRRCATTATQQPQQPSLAASTQGRPAP
jgi:carbon-monoxide dehydrogenase large subunit